MNTPHAPGHFWTRARCIPVPLPAYTFIDSDGGLWVSVPAQDVALIHVALFLAGVALVDSWQRAHPEPLALLLARAGEVTIIGPRQLELWEVA
jgi:hypothetical protein